MESPLLRRNLLEKVSAPEPHHVPARVWKEVGIDVLTVVFALWTNFAYRAYLADTGSLIIFLLAVSLFAMLGLLGAIFSHNFLRRVVLMLISSFALVGLFPDSLATLFGASSLTFLLLLAGEITARREMENGLRIKFFVVARSYLRKVATAMVILIVIFLPKFDPTTQEPIFSDRFLTGVFDASLSVAGGVYPEIKFNDSLENFLESDALLQASGDAQFRELTPPQQQLIIGEAVRKGLAQFEKTLGKTLDPAQSFKNFVFDYTKKILSDITAKTKQWIVIIWVVTLFFVFRGIGFIFYWMVALIAFAVYHLLIAFKFAKIAYEQKQHESLEL